MTQVPMLGVREYAEGDGLPLDEKWAVKLSERAGRPIVVALNEGGYQQTEVDLLDVISWLRANRPDLLGA